MISWFSKRTNTYITPSKKFLSGSFGFRGFLLLATFLLFGAAMVYAAVTTTPASGGTNISADLAGNAATSGWTMLSGIVVTEGATTDITKNQSARTLILTAPTNRRFRAGSGSISYVAGQDINAATISVTATTVTATITTPNVGGDNGSDVFTITGVWVQAITGSVITGAVNILRTSGNPGTLVIAGITNDVTSFGSLSQVAGTGKYLDIVLPGQTFTINSGHTGTGTVTGGIAFTVTGYAFDQFRNIIISYTGSKTVTFTGPAGSYPSSATFASGIVTGLSLNLTGLGTGMSLSATGTSLLTQLTNLITVTDYIAPLVSLITPTSGAYLTGNTLFTRSGSDNIALSGYTFSVFSGGTPIYSSGVNSSTTGISYTTGDGSYTWNVVATDTVGNTGTATNRPFIIDTTKPTFAGVSSGGYYSGATITFSDTNLSGAILSGLDNAMYSGNFQSGSSVSSGGRYIFTVYDRAGNSTGAIFTIDTAAPTATITYIPGSGSYTSGDVTATITGFSESITGLNATGHLFTGTETFVFTFQDLAGNTGYATGYVNWIDKISPTFAGVNSGVEYTAPVSITFDDNNTGFSAMLNGTGYASGDVILTNGLYEFIVTDIVGNSTGATFTINITSDKSALSGKLAEANSNASSTYVSIDGSDVYTFNQRVDSGVMATYTGAIASAQAVFDNSSATQGAVDTATSNLSGATADFNTAKAYGTLAVDKSALSGKLAEANSNASATYVSIDGSDVYTFNQRVDSGVMATYTGAIATAQGVFDNLISTQGAVDAATSNLSGATADFNTAKAYGTLAVDKSALSGKLADANSNAVSVTVSVDGSDVYTFNQRVYSGQMATYTGAIASAQAVYDNPSATQGAVDTATSNLSGATADFDAVKTNGSLLVDKSVLSGMIDDANNNLLTVSVSVDGSDVYTFNQRVDSGENSIYIGAIVSGQWVFDYALSTQLEVDNAVLMLSGATADFNTGKAYGTLAVDKSALSGKLADANSNAVSVTVSVDGSDVYTFNQRVDSGQMATYTGAIASAQAVYDNPISTQGAVDTATSNLSGATATFNGAKAYGTLPINIPVITLSGSTPITIEVGSSYIDAGASAFDTEDGDLTSSIITSGTVNPALTGTYYISYDVTDSSGNNAVQVVRTINVTDTIAPVITLSGANPQSIVSGFAYVELGASAYDTGDGDLTPYIVIDSSAVNTSATGTYTVYYTVSDSSGNPSTGTRTVNVVDANIPVITLSGSTPITIEVGSSYIDAGASAFDTEDGDLTSSIITSGTVNPALTGTYYISYDVTDSSGNVAVQVVRTINVTDTIAPVITLSGANPQSIVSGFAYVELGASAYDTGDGDLTPYIVIDSSAVNTSATGTYTVYYTVSDSSGNPSTGTRTVNVVDANIPVITLSGSTPITIFVGSSYADAGASAFDTEDGDLTSSIITSGTVNTALTGTYYISYDVTDSSGNNAVQVVRTINVEDITTSNITGTTTVDGSVTITDAASTGATFTATGTLVIESGSNQLILDLSGLEITASGTWNKILLAPQSQSGVAAFGEPGLPDPTLTVGSTTTTRVIVETIQAGGSGTSLSANAGNTFRISFRVSSGTSGQELKLYRSEDGANRVVNTPQASCILNASLMCSFLTDSLSYFAGVTETTTTAGGGGGGSTVNKDSCPNGDTSSSFYDGLCSPAKTTIKTVGGQVIGVGTTVGDITNSPYSQELNDAYLFAFANGITTMKTVQDANLDGALSRKDMAKMMVNYAIKVLDKSPDSTIVCSFTDVANQTVEAKFYANVACQLGIMGMTSEGTPAKSFNPNGIVTRSEFGTVLSRILYGTAYDGGTPYYLNHLNALKTNNIITNTNPNLNELRGYVMLMLMRSAQ